MVVYDLTRTEPQAGWSVTGGVLLALEEVNGRMAAVCDTVLSFGDAAGKTYGEYHYDGAYLRDWSVGGDYTVLRLNRYYAGSIGRIGGVGGNGKLLQDILNRITAGKRGKHQNNQKCNRYYLFHSNVLSFEQNLYSLINIIY